MTTAAGYWGRLNARPSKGALRLFLRALLPFLGVLLLAGAASFSWRMHMLDTELDATVVAFLDLTGTRLQRDLQLPIEDLHFLAQELGQLGTTAANAEHLGGLLGNLGRARHRYRTIRVLDAAGVERIGREFPAGAPTEIVDWSHTNLFSAIAPLQGGELYVSSFELRTAGGKVIEPLEPIVRFATPFADATSRRAGYVLIELDASEALGAVQVANPDGFVELLTSDGYWVKARDSQLEWGAVLRERSERLFSTRNARAWEAMTQNERGHIRTEHGGFWYRAVRPLEASIQNPVWTLVLHVPTERMHARALGVATGLAALALCAALMAAPFYWWLARRAAARK